MAAHSPKPRAAAAPEGPPEGAPGTLAATATFIRSKDINWNLYEQKAFLDKEQYAMMTAYDRKPAEVQAEILTRSGSEYAKLFLDILMKCGPQHEELAMYLITMIDDMLAPNPAVATLFHNLHDVVAAYPYGPFLALLSRAESTKNSYIIQKTCKILTGLHCVGRPMPEGEFVRFLTWLAQQLRSENEADVIVAVASLQALLRNNLVKEQFWGVSHAFPNLVELLSTYPKNYQLVYQVLFCIWLLSYNERIAPQLNSKLPLLPPLMKVIRNVPKEYEKVVRVAIGIVHNLIDKAGIGQAIVSLGFMLTLKVLQARKWADDDIPPELGEIDTLLQQYEQDLSSFGQYKAEVTSFQLSWSPVHKSESFWKKNVENFSEDNYQLLRVLIQIVSHPERYEPVPVNVATYDLGEFVRFHPRGKQILEYLGGKLALMELMAKATDPEIQAQAVLSVQKMMIKNWEFVSRGSGAPAAPAAAPVAARPKA